ncbi:helix-turn-helix transcriptional regulator [Pseudidiomarina marina]|uniref:AlpA family transcriptional regulator n=1 Tax=Pseudidiomarina marina TaxID=502366 RepID=A0A432YCD7_9GAMM|nr:hypothetical protein CWI76_11085 [Pseudidiomarina marina]
MYIDIREVKRNFSISKSTLYRWIKERDFPEPKRFSPRLVRWNKNEVEEWDKNTGSVSKNKSMHMH